MGLKQQAVVVRWAVVAIKGSLFLLYKTKADHKSTSKESPQVQPTPTPPRPKMNRFALLSLLFACAQAFQLSLPIHSAKIATPSTMSRHVILSDAETEKILQSAGDCAEGECSVDDVSELIYELKQQEKEMQQRLEKIMNMISHLQHINEKEERQTDEVRAFVKDMLRVFSFKAPATVPMGYSGDVGKGSQTAYDVLPPKKWKPSA